MKFSISIWIYGKEDIEKGFARAKKYGYDGIEVEGEPDKYDVKRLNELFSSYNLEASSIAGMYPWPTDERDLSNPDPKVRERAINYLKKCCEFANRIGAPLIIVVPGCVGKVRPVSTREEEWKLAVASVREAAKYAEEYGVVYAIEPINRYETYLLNNVDQGLKFVEEVNHDNVKLMLDCFHMNIEEPDPAYAIRKAGKMLIHVHVADSNRQSVGRGHTDFKAIIRSLKEIGFNRYLAIEPLPPLADPYMMREQVPPEDISDMFAEECIQQLKYFVKIT